LAHALMAHALLARRLPLCIH